MPYRFRLSCSALAFMLVGCFSVDDDPAMVDSDTDAGTDGATSSDPTGDPSTSGPTTTVSTTVDSTADSETEDGDPVCGDGEVNGDEVCDDGTNDGSYGSCLEDCSGMAEHCGDGEINGDEVCDDGRNDGSYGGCASDCASLGPHCGDGAIQDPEVCDDGENNENGAGCNIDCNPSGTLLEEYWSDPLISGTCSSGTATPPVFRSDGNLLIAATGNCGGNTTELYEFSPTLDIEESTDAILPEAPRRATMRGDEWLMAGWNCNFAIAETGELDEICDPDRTAGTEALESDDSEVYVALNYTRLAQYGAGSPALDDSPNWTYTPTQGSTSYYFYTAAFGASGSVAIAGEYYNGSTWYGHVRRFTANGNSAGTANFTDVTYIYGLRRTPSGGFAGIGYKSGEDSGYRVFSISQTLALQWAEPLDDSAAVLYDVVVDSSGDIVVEHRGAMSSDRSLSKLSSSGDLRWTHELEFEFNPGTGRLAVAEDSNDAIIRSSVEYNPLIPELRLRVTKISP